MRWLEEHLFVIIIALFAIFVVMLGFYHSAEGEDDNEPPISVYEKRIVEIDRQALEQAYQSQVQHLFENWVKDPAGQPARATKGTRIARKAFIDAMTALDKREQRIPK